MLEQVLALPEVWLVLGLSLVVGVTVSVGVYRIAYRSGWRDGRTHLGQEVLENARKRQRTLKRR